MVAPQADDLGSNVVPLLATDTDQHGPDAGEQIAQMLTHADSQALVQPRTRRCLFPLAAQRRVTPQAPSSFFRPRL
jgi:hypothetical protein